MSLGINIYVMWAYKSIYESSLLLIAPVHIKLVNRCPLHKKLLATVQIRILLLTLLTLDLNTSYTALMQLYVT